MSLSSSNNNTNNIITPNNSNININDKNATPQNPPISNNNIILNSSSNSKINNNNSTLNTTYNPNSTTIEAILGTEQITNLEAEILLKTLSNEKDFFNADLNNTSSKPRSQRILDKILQKYISQPMEFKLITKAIGRYLYETAFKSEIWFEQILYFLLNFFVKASEEIEQEILNLFFLIFNDHKSKLDFNRLRKFFNPEDNFFFIMLKNNNYCQTTFYKVIFFHEAIEKTFYSVDNKEKNKNKHKKITLLALKNLKQPMIDYYLMLFCKKFKEEPNKLLKKDIDIEKNCLRLFIKHYENINSYFLKNLLMCFNNKENLESRKSFLFILLVIFRLGSITLFNQFFKFLINNLASINFSTLDFGILSETHNMSFSLLNSSLGFMNCIFAYISDMFGLDDDENSNNDINNITLNANPNLKVVMGNSISCSWKPTSLNTNSNSNTNTNINTNNILSNSNNTNNVNSINNVENANIFSNNETKINYESSSKTNPGNTSLKNSNNSNNSSSLINGDQKKFLEKMSSLLILIEVFESICLNKEQEINVIQVYEFYFLIQKRFFQFFKFPKEFKFFTHGMLLHKLKTSGNNDFLPANNEKNIGKITENNYKENEDLYNLTNNVVNSINSNSPADPFPLYNYASINFLSIYPLSTTYDYIDPNFDENSVIQNNYIFANQDNFSYIKKHYYMYYPEYQKIIQQYSEFLRRRKFSMIFANWLTLFYKEAHSVVIYEFIRALLCSEKEGSIIFYLIIIKDEMSKFIRGLWMHMVNLIMNETKSPKENYNMIINLKYIFFYELTMQSQLRQCVSQQSFAEKDSAEVFGFFKKNFKLLSNLFYIKCEDIVENYDNCSTNNSNTFISNFINNVNNLQKVSNSNPPSSENNNGIKISSSNRKDSETTSKMVIENDATTNNKVNTLFLATNNNNLATNQQESQVKVNNSNNNSNSVLENMVHKMKVEILNIFFILLNNFKDPEVISDDVLGFVKHLLEIYVCQPNNKYYEYVKNMSKYCY